MNFELESDLKRTLSVMKIGFIELQTFFGTNRDQLGVLDQIDQIPFTASRLFFHHNISADSVRGKHAHILCRQLLIPVEGSCKIKLLNKYGEISFDFNGGGFAILVPVLTWIEMSEFTEDYVGLTLADRHYESHDYIYDLKELKGNWKHDHR